MSGQQGDAQAPAEPVPGQSVTVTAGLASAAGAAPPLGGTPELVNPEDTTEDSGGLSHGL